MTKGIDTFIERRKYVRLLTPLNIAYAVSGSGNLRQGMTKNISADGLRFETTDPDLKETTLIEIKLDIPTAPNPIHAKGKIVWRKRVSLEDGSPFDCGVEFTEIEEDNKNTFLKFLCDLIYDIEKILDNGKAKR
jgi:c-di-GMP-binding flagellar brake protein YcgR